MPPPNLLTKLADAPLRSQVRRTYTGKSGGRNDDIVITLQLALAGARMFYQSDRYRQFRLAQNGHQKNHGRSVP